MRVFHCPSPAMMAWPPLCCFVAADYFETVVRWYCLALSVRMDDLYSH